MNHLVSLFDSRLNTLEHLLRKGASHFGNDEFLSLALVADMLPLGTQITFTCNQPLNFAQWVNGETVTNLDPDVPGVDEATGLITRTRKALASIDSQAVLPDGRRLEFGGDRYAELSGEEYVNDFLLPNFYFHLVTAYDILRANGVQIGKADYMAHLVDRVRQ